MWHEEENIQLADDFEENVKDQGVVESDEGRVALAEGQELFFKLDDKKLVEEADVITGVKAVPNGQKDQSDQLTQHLVVEETTALVNWKQRRQTTG